MPISNGPSSYAALAMLLVTGSPAGAADYPERPITLVVPYAPGGSSDIVGRLYAQALEERLGQRVVVENVAGAGGTIGAQRAATAEPDGYTLFVGSGSELFIFRYLNPAPTYDALTDFTPIGMLGVGAMVLVARPDLPVEALPDLLALPGASELNYGSAGVGTFMHLAGEAINFHAGLDIEHVPYRGAGPLMVDIVGSQVDLGVSSLAGALPFIEGGQAKALAVSSPERSALAPDIPTLAETPIMDSFDLELWIGLFTPAGTSPEIVAIIDDATQEIVGDEAFAERLSEQAMQVRPDLRDDTLAAYLREQDRKYGSIVTDAGITAN